MPHKRREIRTHIVTLLKAGNTSAGQRVYASKVRPGIVTQYPIVAVYTPKEDAKVIGANPHHYERTLELVIECISEDINTDVENKLDLLLNEIEAIIDTDELLIPDVSEIEYTGTIVDLFDAGDKDVASGIIRYNIKYYTVEGVPDPDPLWNIEINGSWIKPE